MIEATTHGSRGHRVSRLDLVSADIADRGFEVTLPPETQQRILDAGFTSKNAALAVVTADILSREQPITLRGLFYRVVSAGWLPSTDDKHYDRLGRIACRLREHGCVPFSWIVDSLRSTQKPSSWTGLHDFVDVARDAYRRDFWASLPEYPHVICEKDAISGTLLPVTEGYDVPLSPIRGYCSLSFVMELCSVWNRSGKPVHAYYLGDCDPSGYDIERDLREKVDRYCSADITWRRIAVQPSDIVDFGLIPLRPKKSDQRYARFVREHGAQAVEVDALPATELRRRVREAIESHIDPIEWDRLQDIEQQERQSFEAAMRPFLRGN